MTPLKASYGGIRSKHPTLAARAAVEAARRFSHATIRPSNEDDEEEEPKLGLAQKLFLGRSYDLAHALSLANEENTFNINDLWVSAAVAQDTAVFEDDDTEAESGAQSEDNEDEEGTPQPSPGPTPAQGLTPSIHGSQGRASSFAGRRMSRNRITSGSVYKSLASHRMSMTQGGRRFSTSSGNMPAIYNNTGLQNAPGAIALPDTSPSAQADQDPFFASPNANRTGGAIGGLSVISERPGQRNVRETSPLVSPEVQLVSEKKESAWKLLPLLVISQVSIVSSCQLTFSMDCSRSTARFMIRFSCLSLCRTCLLLANKHCSLRSPYKSGGIGLNPANFSFLIAAMCIFQLIYQFWLYPRLGPPLGRFSHLQMFRLGIVLYLPSYLLAPFLHSIASPDKQGGFLVMTSEAIALHPDRVC